ncbi:Uncharacterized integral membrane protein Mlr5338 [hydrothermal vent metagenome]|uniref:Uncharacterized integral membrane protein Mlr5338 n=1 Tax=hydrothermal vent metagenome TaxID=652676 RepID=A0A3B0SXP1_9ZZZZ
MITAISKALEQLFTPPFRSVLFKSLGLVIGIFVVIGAALQAFIVSLPELPYPWLDQIAAAMAGFGILVSMWFLIVPVTALVAGLFLDEIAAAVETRYYPMDPAGREQPFGRTVAYSVRFALVVLGLNLLALPFYLFPPLGLAVHFVLNGYLLGREYFELAALRHMSFRDARSFRRHCRGEAFLAGAVLAGLLLIPVVNFFVPIFGAAFMVHVYKGLSSQNQAAAREAVSARR